MWSVSANHGDAVETNMEFMEGARVRLGCGGPRDPMVCGCCHKGYLDQTGRHETTCSTGEATRGHNRCVATLFHYARIVDPDSRMEPRELVPSQPSLRPADLLTAAACRLTAADLGITSPGVSSSAEAAKDKMVKRKNLERAGLANELQR